MQHCAESQCFCLGFRYLAWCCLFQTSSKSNIPARSSARRPRWRAAGAFTMTLVKEGALIRPFSAAFSLGGCPYRRRPQKKPPGPRARIPDTDFFATRVPQRTRVASADDWQRVFVRHGIHRLVGLGHLMESMPANWFQESCVVFVVVCCVLCVVCFVNVAGIVFVVFVVVCGLCVGVCVC